MGEALRTALANPDIVQKFEDYNYDITYSADNGVCPRFTCVCVCVFGGGGYTYA